MFGLFSRRCWTWAERDLHHPHGPHHRHTHLKLESIVVACSSKSSIILISELWLRFRNKLRCKRSQHFFFLIMALDLIDVSTFENVNSQIWHCSGVRRLLSNVPRIIFAVSGIKRCLNVHQWSFINPQQNDTCSVSKLTWTIYHSLAGSTHSKKGLYSNSFVISFSAVLQKKI